MTKNEKRLYLIERWKRATATDLYDVYKRPSSRKYRAYLHCMDLFYLLNGTDFRITSHNCSEFSVSFQFVNPETGVVQLMVITKSGQYVYDM